MSKRYTDQVQIQIDLRDGGMLEPATEEWYIAINPTPDGEGIDRDIIRDELLSTLAPDNFTLRETHSTVSWGAASEIFELVMNVGYGVTGAFLHSRIEGYLDKVRSGSTVAIPEDEAGSEARGAVCRKYPIDYGDLVVVETEVNYEQKQTRVELSAPDGSRFSVVVARKGGSITLARIVHTPA